MCAAALSLLPIAGKGDKRNSGNCSNHHVDSRERWHAHCGERLEASVQELQPPRGQARAKETRSTKRWDPPEDLCFRGIKIDRDFHVHRYACDAEFYSRAYCHIYATTGRTTAAAVRAAAAVASCVHLRHQKTPRHRESYGQRRSAVGSRIRRRRAQSGCSTCKRMRSIW
eukprot:COSAG05_NODE_929_length_6558_cov_3.005264_9_plen_170_part_00